MVCCLGELIPSARNYQEKQVIVGVAIAGSAGRTIVDHCIERRLRVSPEAIGTDTKRSDQLSVHSDKSGAISCRK